MVRVWKTKSPLFCLRYDPLIVFWRQNHITFIFIKTMSQDLLVQMAYCSYKQLFRPLWGSWVWRNNQGKLWWKISAHSNLSPDLELSTPTESSHATCLLGGKSPSVKLMSRRENKELAKTKMHLSAILGPFTDWNDTFPNPFMYHNKWNPFPFIYLRPAKLYPFNFGVGPPRIGWVSPPEQRVLKISSLVLHWRDKI